MKQQNIKYPNVYDISPFINSQQLTTTVNVEYPRFLKTPMHRNNDPNQPVIQFFEIVTDDEESRFRGRNDSIMEMRNCVRSVFYI